MRAQFKRIPLSLGARSGDLIAAVVMALVCLGFFWRMAFTDLILPRGDAFTYFYPYWAYRSEILTSGNIPLWNPYLFMGVPFLANSQAGVLYPPNWLLIGLDAPTAVKTAAVGHIILASWGMYIFSRRELRLSIIAGCLAGLTFALGGYVTSQVEHINQLQGLAWLPWVFWLGGEAAGTGRLQAIVGLGAVLALQLLAGHTQTAFITVVGLGLWMLWRWFGEWRRLRQLAQYQKSRWQLLLALRGPAMRLTAGGLIGAGLACAQLLPTLELTRLSNRSGGLPFIEALSFSLRPYLLGRALLPQYSSPSLFSEYVAYIGVVGLILAMLGAWAGRRNWKYLGIATLAGVAIFLALGAYNPVYWGLVRIVPGFRFFRAPARWLALWAFAAAGLAGLGLDWLQAEAGPPNKRLPRVRWPWIAILVLIIVSLLAPLAGDEVPGATRPQVLEFAAWIGSLAAITGAVAWILWAKRGVGYAAAGIAALSVVELFVAAQVLPFNRLTVPEAWDGQRPSISTLLAGNQGSVPPARFLSLSDTLFDPGDLHEIEASYRPYLNKDQIYDYVVATKYKEILAPNLPLYWHIPAMDGFDGGLLPTADYTRFTALFLDRQAVSPDGRLRENLKAVPDLTWLSLANVRWIITDKVNDAWVDGVYYDLQFPEQRVAGVDGGNAEPIQAYPAGSFDATEVGIVGHVESEQSLPDGTRIGTVAVFPMGSASALDDVELPLVVRTAFPGAISAIDGGNPVSAGSFTRGNPTTIDYRTVVTWDSPRAVGHIEVRPVSSFSGTLVIRGMTLIDGRTGAFAPTTQSPNHTLRVANSGDVKVYEYQGALSRAYLVCKPTLVADNNSAWSALQSTAIAGGTVIVDSAQPVGNCDDAHAGAVKIITYQPENVVIQANVASDSSYLVLSDAWYPGWDASIDGLPTPVLKANGLFRAVRVPSGIHNVVFAYRSLSFEAGAAVSGLFLIGIIAAVIWVSSRRKTN